VIVFGTGLSLEKLAQWAETIPYEIMTTISQRGKTGVLWELEFCHGLHEFFTNECMIFKAHVNQNRYYTKMTYLLATAGFVNNTYAIRENSCNSWPQPPMHSISCYL
jgi:hypothetical protein